MQLNRHVKLIHSSSTIFSYYLFLGETVVTNAKHMSGAWKSEGSEQVQPGTKVADYVKAGGENYNVVNDNCHDGSDRMMNVGKEEKQQGWGFKDAYIATWAFLLLFLWLS